MTASAMRRPLRLLLVPGLHDSGPAHWQSWLQAQFRDARRVEQQDFGTPHLDSWAERVAETAASAPDVEWLAVAHSFGCLALARYLAQSHGHSRVRAALFVAPADPDKFDASAKLPGSALNLPSTVVGSRTDPWMSADKAQVWAHRWRSHWIDLGDAGHINTEAGFGPLPLARRWVIAAGHRVEREHRPARASVAEWSFAV